VANKLAVVSQKACMYMHNIINFPVHLCAYGCVCARVNGQKTVTSRNGSHGSIKRRLLLFVFSGDLNAFRNISRNIPLIECFLLCMYVCMYMHACTCMWIDSGGAITLFLSFLCGALSTVTFECIPDSMRKACPLPLGRVKETSWYISTKILTCKNVHVYVCICTWDMPAPILIHMTGLEYAGNCNCGSYVRMATLEYIWVVLQV
jgi:hypothetical protein